MESSLITRLGHHGDGILETGGFVPFTLPGERVAAEAPHRVLAASPARVAAPCPQFEMCGGCALQHASDAFLAAWKQEVVERSLSAQGLKARFRPAHTSPLASRRRAVLAARRTKKGVQIGFHGRRSDQIVSLQGCTVLRPEILAIIPELEPLVRAGASRKGLLRVQVTASEAGLDVSIGDGKLLDQALRTLLATEARKMDLARLSWGNEVIALARPPIISMADAQVVPPPGAFLQATVEGQEALVAGVKDAIEGSDGPVLDLFAGCGTFALPMASSREVHAVEGDSAMLKALDTGWRGAARMRAVSTEVRDLFRRPLLGPELTRFGAAVVDPPRAGAEAQVAALAASKIARIVMVSCNPVTFARDAKVLVSAGYRLDWVQVIDQFRWSPHIELVSVLRR